MKKTSLLLLLTGALLYNCTNDTKIREELLNACSAARTKVEPFCKCVGESKDMKECMEAGKVAQAEILKLDSLFDKKLAENPGNDAVSDSYKEKKEVQRANQDCANKYLDKGGEKWW